jgi:LPS sulfotransferase NodH/glycosyltransferase involved in cell wall biosynthesis
MNMIPKTRVYCISLAKSANRQAFASNASRYSVSFDFFDAVSADDLRQGKTVEGCTIDITNLAWTLHERADPRRQRAPLLFTEIGCAYSHILCWQRAKQENTDYLVMFEDDAVMCRSLEGVAIPPDADMLYISNRMPRNSRGEAVGYRGSGTEGYILSRAGIAKCLEIFSVLYMPLDLQLIAHQRSMHGLGLSQYRRTLPDDLYLSAYVAPQPYCYHSIESSQLHQPASVQQAPGNESSALDHPIRRPEIAGQKAQSALEPNKPEIFGPSGQSSAAPRTSSGRLPPKISLVICSRNRVGQLAAMLGKLDLADLTRNAIELNLVDSASTDSTYESMREFKNKNSLPVNIAQTDHPGLGLARNVGLKIASGDVIVFTDDDCYLGTNYFTALSALWDERSFQYGGGQVLMHDDSLDPRIAGLTIYRRQNIPPRVILTAGSIQGANMFFAREVFQRAGLFNENMGSGTPFPCEDIEMATRASVHGFHGVLLPELKVVHDHRRKRGSPEADRTVEGYDFGRGAYYAALFAAGYIQRSEMPNKAKLLREIEGAERYLELVDKTDQIKRTEVEPSADRPRHSDPVRSTRDEAKPSSETVANVPSEIANSSPVGPSGPAAKGSRAPIRYNELQLSSDLLDQPHCPVRAKVFICSTPRTGSYLLCRAMIHHGIGIPHEYFHALHAAKIGPRIGIDALQDGWLLKTDAGIRRTYIREVMSRRAVNGIFSAKVQWSELVHFLLNSEGLELFQNGHFLYLYREDLLAQAISLHISYQTGRWGFDDLVTSEPRAEPNFLDNASINKYLDEISLHDMAWRRFFARQRISPLIVSYESLIADTGSVLRSMVETFNLELSSTDFAYTEERSTDPRDPRVPAVSEIKAHFLNEHQRVFQAPQAAIRTSGGAVLTGVGAPASEAESRDVQPDAK